MCDVSKKTVVLYHVQYDHTAKALINLLKQLITHFLCEQVCEKIALQPQTGKRYKLVKQYMVHKV